MFEHKDSYPAGREDLFYCTSNRGGSSVKYYTCYETERTRYADGYENEKIAQEYAEEARAEGYTNVKVLTEEELLLECKSSVF